MYNKLLRKNLSTDLLKKSGFGAVILVGFMSLYSCSTCSYGAAETTDWAKGNKLKNVYVIEMSDASEGFKTDLMYNLRIDLAKYGINNAGSSYAKKALDAEETLEKKVIDFNPDYIIYLRNTHNSYNDSRMRDEDLMFHRYSIKIEDRKNKAIAFKTICATGPKDSKNMAKDLIAMLKKEKFINNK